MSEVWQSADVVEFDDGAMGRSSIICLYFERRYDSRIISPLATWVRYVRFHHMLRFMYNGIYGLRI